MKKSKLSILEIVFCYGIIIKEFLFKKKRRNVVRKEIINGEIVTIVDVKYKEVA